MHRKSLRCVKFLVTNAVYICSLIHSVPSIHSDNSNNISTVNTAASEHTIKTQLLIDWLKAISYQAGQQTEKSSELRLTLCAICPLNNKTRW